MAGVPESLIKTLLDEFRSIAKTETIIGKEFEAGEFTLIPISRVSLGIGAGGGSGGTKAESRGEGGGGEVSGLTQLRLSPSRHEISVSLKI